MCGILSIINTSANSDSKDLINASAIIRHRGPDDEGFLTWSPGQDPVVWAGEDTAGSTKEHWDYNLLPPAHEFKVGFGHRRLSILDLSPAGHQPMIYKEAGLAITFNGEVYNYLEIRDELLALKHIFETKTDTEVILHAWAQWGPACLTRFNGMFAFVMLDYRKATLHAVRDRFGVKPLYYYSTERNMVFTSEIKQIKSLAGFKPNLNERIAKQFLAVGAVDHTSETFDTQIKQLPGGHYLQVDLTTGSLSIKQWYQLLPKPWKGGFETAVAQFKYLLTDAVKLRLRSDVAVGSCLSGGLDSSSIVCIAADLLKEGGNHAGQETVTARYENAKYDEWTFAEEVIKQTNAHAHQTFPSFHQLTEEIDSFLWHQDEPTGSTSQFSQWAVFKKTHEVGLKVMIDGQGADEQLAGYGGNDTSFYAGLLRKGQLLSLIDESRHYKREKKSWPYGFLLGALQLSLGKSFSGMFPDKLKIDKSINYNWVVNSGPLALYAGTAQTLLKNLLRQIYGEPLPGLLRYEDRNSMAWSVESRTPFMDYRLVEFTLGLPERFVYRNGVRKHILRKAMSGILPKAIENRKDKMGFVTPEEVWLKGEGRAWFNETINIACEKLDGYLIDGAATRKYVDEIMNGTRPFDFTPWRIVCFYKWYSSNNSRFNANG